MVYSKLSLSPENEKSTWKMKWYIFSRIFPPFFKVTIQKETCNVLCNHIVTYKNGKKLPCWKRTTQKVLNKKISSYEMFRRKESDFAIPALNGKRNDPEVYFARWLTFIDFSIETFINRGKSPALAKYGNWMKYYAVSQINRSCILTKNCTEKFLQ